MALYNWLVQSCCNSAIVKIIKPYPSLSEGVIFQDSLGDCYQVISPSNSDVNINLTDETLYHNCDDCINNSKPCDPRQEPIKLWLVQSCCNKEITEIISDNTLSPGDTFQDSLGTCYTVLMATEGNPTIVRGNELVYKDCKDCGPCASPIPSKTPAVTETPIPTQTVTPTITATPSTTTYNFVSKTPSVTSTPTVTPTISITPSITSSPNSPVCKCITYINTSVFSSYNCFYDDCGGIPNVRFSLGPQATAQICGNNPSVGNPAVTFYTGSTCIGDECTPPDITPTPTPTPSATSVSGSFVSPDDLCMDIVFGPAPSLSPTPTITVSATPSITVSPSPYPINPSISPTSTISATPSVTPTKTPTSTPSTTVSNTPSVTPTLTVTPTISITTTPTVSITPTKTPTVTPSPTRNAIVVPECAAIYIDISGNIYSYNNTTNISTFLFNPGGSYDIAHTTDKLWVYNPTIIYEYNITLSSFTSILYRTYNLPVGVRLGAGLCAVNNTTLISSNTLDNNRIIKITLNPVPDNTTIIENLFYLPSGRQIAGDFIYTTDNKIILTTESTSGPVNSWISQYTIINGVWTLEFDLLITYTAPGPFGLATINGGIYIFSQNNFKQINTTSPYAVTQINNIGANISGASQVPSCCNVSFQPNITPPPTECPVYINSFSIINGAGIFRQYYYSLLTNTSTLVTTSPYPNSVGGNVNDITFSSTKFWYLSISTNGVPFNPSTYTVHALITEFNLINSLNMVYNRTLDITLPSNTSSSGYAGLCVLNSNTLLSTRAIGTSSTALYYPVIIALDITNNGTSTDIFTAIQGRFITGMLYTTTGKLLTISNTQGGQIFITQYSYPSGVVEFDLPVQYGNGSIFENNGSIYFIVSSALYKINNTAPYSITYINNISPDTQGSSGINDCNTVNFVPNISPTPSLTPSVTPTRTPTPTPSPSAANSNCTGNLPLPGGSLVYNGITVTASGSGALTSYPNYLASCAVTSQTNTIDLGYPGPLLPFSYTLTFSQPVNNIKLILTAIGGIAPYVENITFTTSAGTPTVLSNDSCYVSILGNTIKGTGLNGGGTFAISAPSSYTTLTVSGLGGGNNGQGVANTPMSIDCNSIAPFQSNCASCDIQSLPVGGNGSIVSNNVTLTTTYSGPQIPSNILPNPTNMTCVGLASPSPFQTVALGYNSGAFIYTINFSQPVNNIKFLISGAGSTFDPTAFEYFTFNTNGGVPTLTSCGPSCGTTINNNTLQMGLVLPNGGGILAQVSATNNYTQLIITGPGGLQGSAFSLCADTAIPLPSLSPSVTPSITATPSKTPTITVTPSISTSVAPSTTPSATTTPTPTPSPSSGFASSCGSMLYRSQYGTGYGSYNFTTNTPTPLTVAANPYPSNDTINAIPAVIANTSNKMWVYATGATTSEVNLRESNIVLSPFSSAFNRNITLPAGYKPANGLFALNNTTLVGTFVSYNDVTINSIPIVELNITSNIATATTKCTLPYLVKPVGGLIVTTGANPKLLILTRYGANGALTISQYDYTTGALEFKKQLPSTVQVPSGLAEVNGSIYIIGSNVYKIDTVAPYNLTLIQTIIGSQIINTSQVAACIDTNFSTANCDACNLGILSQNNTLTYNGITIVPSYVGPPNAYTNGIYTEVDSNCVDTNAFSIPAGSLTLGQYANTATPAPFTYTMTFSQPVNNVKLIIGGMGGVTYTTQESFAFTTNVGAPIISSCKGCLGSINGNTITASLNDVGVQSSGTSAGGIITLTAPTSYTTLTISGPGGVYGSTFAICTNTVQSLPQSSPSVTPSITVTPTPTPSTSPPSTGLLGCVYYSKGANTYNYNVITNTSTQVTLPNDTFTDFFAETHTSTRYYKGNQTDIIKEWEPTNNPTTLSLTRTITISGITSLLGNYFFFLQAINNTTLLTTIVTSQTTPAGLYNYSLIKMDITNNTVTPAQMTTLFDIYAPDGLDSILLTTTNKLLTIGRRNTPTAPAITYLSQYSYPDGALELDIDISSIITQLATPRYLFESNGNLFLSTDNIGPVTNIYNININSPYTLTPVWLNVNASGGGSKFNSSLNCNTVNLMVPSTCCPTEYSAPQIGSTVVINGITIGGSGNGSILSFTDPSYIISCFSDPTSALNTIELGDNNPPFTNNPSFTYTMTFSQPVNNFKVKLESINLSETFTFTTNNGTPSLTGCTNCCTTINGNVISINTSDPRCEGYNTSFSNGSGYFGISNALPFTTLTISGPGGGGGTILKLCDISPSTPSLTPTPTPSSSPPSAAFRTIYKYLDIQ